VGDLGFIGELAFLTFFHVEFELDGGFRNSGTNLYLWRISWNVEMTAIVTLSRSVAIQLTFTTRKFQNSPKIPMEPCKQLSIEVLFPSLGKGLILYPPCQPVAAKE
jgi:hypothetical protein